MTGILNKVREGDLYALLSLCTKEELAPLVESVLSRPSNSLDLDEAYKAHQPDHTKYYQKIGDEIRLFGGNAILNILRGSKNPDYAEIVSDVCKKLGVPCQKGNTLANENNLLDLLVEQHWKSLSPAAREALAATARQSALGKMSDVADLTRAAVTFAVTRVLPKQAHQAARGISRFDAAFKVTVPCVVHIAYLRRKILEEQRGVLRLSGATAHPLETTRARQAPMASPHALAIQTEEGETLLSLARLDTRPDGNWQEMGQGTSNHANADRISKLNPLLQLVPGLATASELAGKTYMQVVTNGDRLLRTRDGILKAVTVGEDGKFSGIANVIEPDRLSALVNASALWQIGSVALAQKHLADIGKKLSRIQNGIDDIRKYLQDERHAFLTGSIRYFNQIAPAILAGELPDRMLQQIERHEVDLLRVQDHLTDEIRTLIAHIQTLRNDETFGSADITSTIENLQQRLGLLYRELLLCLRARACGWQLLCVFPGETFGKAARRKDLQTALDQLENGDIAFPKADRALRAKIHAMSSMWNRSTTLNERKLARLRATGTLIETVKKARSAFQHELEAADALCDALQQPITLTARIENHRITALRPS